jgi:pimeloyl-ACP methyl ester carboxylesterase
MWIYLVGNLSRHFRIYALDTMGDMGMSVPSRELTQASDYAAWLTDTLDGLDIGKASIAGISWGGGIALSAALFIPERVDRVIALCPAWGLARPRMLTFLFHILPSVLFPNKERLRKLFRWFSVSKSAFSSELDEQLLDYLVVALKHYKMQKGKLWVFTDDELRSIKTPTLLLIGDHEVLYDADTVAERARQFMPNLRAEIVPDASHALFYDRPDIVERQIVEFLWQSSD